MMFSTMGGRTYRTIHDLRGDSFVAVCRGCGHTATVPRAALLNSGAKTLWEIKLRCSSCGGRDIVWHIEKAKTERHWLDAMKRDKE